MAQWLWCSKIPTVGHSVRSRVLLAPVFSGMVAPECPRNKDLSLFEDQQKKEFHFLILIGVNCSAHQSHKKFFKYVSFIFAPKCLCLCSVSANVSGRWLSPSQRLCAVQMKVAGDCHPWESTSRAEAWDLLPCLWMLSLQQTLLGCCFPHLLIFFFVKKIKRSTSCCVSQAVLKCSTLLLQPPKC